MQPDGTFKATTYTSGDGVAEGDYIVTVEWRKAVQKNGEYTFGPNLVPEQYSDRQTSQLEIHVAAQPNVLPPIKLKRLSDSDETKFVTDPLSLTRPARYFR